MFNDPSIQHVGQACSDISPVLHSSSVDMIDCQEFILCFAAANAPFAVMGEYLVSKSLTVFPKSFVLFFSFFGRGIHPTFDPIGVSMLQW